jgi:hypothetical protein
LAEHSAERVSRPVAGLPPLRNAGEHVDRVRVEYRDSNNAGVSAPHDPALVFAKLGHRLFAHFL